MANPHSVINMSQMPGSSSPQTIRLNPFPNLGFTDRAGEMPLDLNSSQKLSQHIMRVPNAFERVSASQTEQRDFDISPGVHGDLGLGVGPDIVMSDGVLDFSSDRAMLDGGPTKITQRSRCHWSHNEIMALFNAKKAEADKYENEDMENEKMGKKARVPPERWDEVAEFCRAMGSNKSASQCKDKWERIWLAFRKITDWEKQPPPGKSSFWAMQGDEREKEGFPRVFDKELYDAMAARFGFLKSIDLTTIVIDSSIVDDSVEAGTNIGSEPIQLATPAVEESPSVVDDQALASAGEKRKVAPRGSVKATPPEGKKKRIVYGVYKVEKVEQNGAPKNTKSKVVNDFNERKLLLEERKLKLAEKRFQLEEKKLEATIEIGKGLITSMERMTHTISSLGVFSSH
ncbi:hypothetical protein L7F22_054741 [Adiantum nelumboides]|nr:hypothetical protein [Adiantum nelumboides]